MKEKVDTLIWMINYEASCKLAKNRIDCGHGRWCEWLKRQFDKYYGPGCLR